MFSRRQFLRTGSLLTVGSVLVTACGTPTPAAPPTAATAAKPAEPTQPAKPTAQPTPAAPPTAATAAKPAEPTQPAKPTAQPTPAAKPAASAESISLVVESYQWDEPWNKPWMEWVSGKLVEESPNIKIERRVAPFTQFWDKLLTEIQAGTAGDIIQGNSDYFEQWAAMGAVAPLDDYMDAKKVIDNSWPVLKERAVRNGKLWGAPSLVTTNRILLYNKQHFDEKGLKVPGKGEFAKWVDVSKKLTTAPNRYGIVVHTLPTNQLNEDYDKFINGFGTTYSLADGTPTLNKPENIEATKLYKDIIDSGATPIGTEKSIYRPMWWNGQISQILDGSWVLGGAMQEKGKALKDLTAAPMPTPFKSVTAFLGVFQMYAKGKHLKEAGRWLEILGSKEGQLVVTKSTGDPTSKEIPDDVIKQMPWLSAFQEVLKGPTDADINPGFAIVRNESNEIIRRYAAECLLGKTPIKDALDKMQSDHEALSKREGGKTF